MDAPPTCNRLEDLGDALATVCRSLDLRSLIMLSSTNKALRRLFQQKGSEVACHAEARVSLHCAATTSQDAAAALARRMLAWDMTRLRLALLTVPAAELVQLLHPTLKVLAVAPDRRVVRVDGVRRFVDEQEEEEVGGEEEEPDWTQGCGPVGQLQHLPLRLERLEAGCLVHCPAYALATAPQLRHISMDSASGSSQLLELLHPLPPLLQSLTLSFGGGYLSDITGRVLHLPSLVRHGTLTRLALRMDTPACPGGAEVLLDGSPQQLWHLSAKVDIELQLGHSEQQVVLVLMPKEAGGAGGEEAEFSLSRWERGRFLGCRLVERLGSEGALARPVKVQLPSGDEEWWGGEWEGDAGEGSEEDEDDLDWHDHWRDFPVGSGDLGDDVYFNWD